MKAFRAGMTLAVTMALLSPAAAADTRTFHNLSPETYACTKDIGEARHNTIYEPRDGNYGTATTSSFFWIIVIAYRYDPETGDLFHEILRRSWIIPVNAVWDGIREQIEECEAREMNSPG
jgi:hypothetical protein